MQLYNWEGVAEFVTVAETESFTIAAKKLVDNYYANRLLQFKVSYETECDTHEVGHEAESLLAKILDYERKLLYKMRANEEVSEEVYIRILSKIDRDQVGFASYK